MKKALLIVLILLTSFTFTGCWNYKEVNDIWVVSGLAIDWDKENGKYIVSAEIIKPKSDKGSTNISEVISFSSYTIFDAMRKFISISGRKLYWSHCYILIVSEETAKHGISQIIDIVSRSDEFRSNIILVISKEETAKEILERKMKVFDITSFELDAIFKSQENLSTYYNSEMWNFRKDYVDEGISPILSAVKLTESNSEYLPQVYGCAVFKKDKFVGYLDDIETESLLFIRNNIKGGDIPIKNLNNTNSSVTLEIQNNKTELKPEIKNNEITMNIKIKLYVAIPEMGGTQNLITENGLREIKECTNKKIKDQLTGLIKKCQNDYNLDVLGYGKVIQKKMPDKWKSLEPQWNKKYFSKVKSNITVETSIISSYRIYKMITGGE